MRPVSRRQFIRKGALFVPVVAGLIRPPLLMAATAFVQSKNADNGFSGATTLTVTTTSNVTSGNAICVYVSWFDASVLSSVTDTRSTSYTLRHNATTVGLGRAAMAYGFLGSTGTCTVTATWATGPVYAVIIIHEVSGVDSSSFDNSVLNAQSAPGSGSNALTSTALTPSAAGCYLFGATSDTALNGETYTAGTGYTARENLNGVYGKSEDQVQGSAASIAATFTASVGASMYGTGLLILKPAGGGGGSSATRSRGFTF